MADMQMTWLVASLFAGVALASLTPLLVRRVKRAAVVLSLLPLAVFGQLCAFLPAVAAGEVIQFSLPWIPQLGLAISFTLDGLSLVMALLISGIGALVLLYGDAYLHQHPARGRFHSLILLFMTAMLGVVLSGNALLVFVFWELTSITSFLLIGFDHERANARAAAWQALLVTGSGGLAMLAGFVLLAQVSGSFEIGHWITATEKIAVHPLAAPAFILILVGAASKSAQFPFHFWLPNAMEAPTPVSAYLHSATMVKAGVYLLARLFPVLGTLGLWSVLLICIGLLTMLGGSLLALAQTDLKRLLAYTTVSALGLLTFLLGLGSPLAIKTAIILLVAHALYKGALFLTAGNVDHGTGRRELSLLGRTGRAMPCTAAAGGLAALSMAGLPPLIGFLAKELIYETTLAAPLPLLLTGLVLAGNAANVIVAVWVGWHPFWGKPDTGELHPHEGPPGLWLPPLLLALLGLFLGLFPSYTGDLLIAPAAQSVLQEGLKVKIALWHGFTPMLALSVLTLLLGFGLAGLRRRFQPHWVDFWHALGKVGPAAFYPRSLNAILSFASWQTRILQSGYLRIYVLAIVLSTVGLAGLTMGLRLCLPQLSEWTPPRFYDVILVGIILTATFLVTRSRSRLATIALLGSIGFSIAILFLLYSAPDLAMVQFAIETLTVILFVLALYRLPKFNRLSSTATRVMDVIVALSGGVMMTLMMMMVSTHSTGSRLADYFAFNSLPLANGRNIVNVILVDFRSFDTLGELTVLAVAAIGVFSLVRLAVKNRHQPPPKGGQTQ